MEAKVRTQLGLIEEAIEKTRRRAQRLIRLQPGETDDLVDSLERKLTECREQISNYRLEMFKKEWP